jgi:hypothetical protein
VTAGELPPAVAALLRAHVESFEQLEVLLHLHRRRDAARSAPMIAHDLRLGVDVVAEALEHFREVGLVERADTSPVVFALSDAAPKADAVAALAKVYDEDRSTVLRLMAGNALDRLRASAIKTFADAFVLGDKPKGKP